MLGYLNKSNIINFSQKATSSDKIEKMHQVVIDGISDNITVLLQTCKYGSINNNKIQPQWATILLNY